MKRREADCVELEIDSLAAGGDGVGRGKDGRVVFAPYTAPGDRVRLRVVQDRPRYRRGEVMELLQPGQGRTDPLCPVFGTCGGCSWQHLDYPTQLEAKRQILGDAVRRIGGLPLPERLPMHASPLPYGYRSRVRVQVRRGRVGFLRRRSHALCPIRRCPVLVPALDQALQRLEGGEVADGEWELSVGDDGTPTALRCGSARRDEDRVRVGTPAGDIEVSAGVFVQANEALRPTLARAVLEAAGRGRRALELFAGAGFFSLGLAAAFDELTAVESDPAAAADLRRNLAGCTGVEILEEAAARALTDPRLAGGPPEVVVLDPPRAGLVDGAAGELAALGAPRIVYLSCDPATLARDLRILADAGYWLEALEGFDLFPQTPHVEALARLEQRRR